MDIVSSPMVGRSLPKTIMFVVRSSALWGAYPQTCPKWDKNFTTTCWCRSMIACQVSWISDEFWIYYNWKNQTSQCFAGNQRCACVWNSFPFLSWDLRMHPRTQVWVSTNLYALEHVHVVQIWIMHINALKTLLMHKNVQTNSKNHNNSHNTPVVLCWHEIFV